MPVRRFCIFGEASGISGASVPHIRNTWGTTVQQYSILVGGLKSPLKNMSSSIGMIFIPNIWENAKNGNQTTNQSSHSSYNLPGENFQKCQCCQSLASLLIYIHHHIFITIYSSYFAGWTLLYADDYPLIFGNIAKSGSKWLIDVHVTRLILATACTASFTIWVIFQHLLGTQKSSHFGYPNRVHSWIFEIYGHLWKWTLVYNERIIAQVVR